jgi:1-deoxy-D-xylulose-5-phosphate synthase
MKFLDRINNPQDLKTLTVNELNILAGEIRGLILEVVSQRGGHLASSLGVVELTLAIHSCLNLPVDSLIFDVGHQCYAHKIITGRKKDFSSLRQYGGISGFPNSKESAYDLFISGHASTAVSWAQGIAEAKKLNQDISKTVAVIGDGALTGGMCFEALNHCGHTQSDVLIIVNHNQMSISHSVGALSNYLTKILSAPVYNRIKTELDNFIKQHSFTKRLAAPAKKFEEALKGLIIPGIFFEEIGFRYFGPINGHDLNVMIPTLKNVLALKGPRILHVITQKGKGYKLAESNPEYFHGTGAFDLVSGTPLKNQECSFGEVFARHLVALAKKDKRIVAITAAMPQGTGLDIFQKEFPQRFFDVGIAEAHAVGFAAGLARQGLKPVVAIYSTFLQRALDQIIHDVALQNLPVIFMLDRAGLVGQDGPTHHGTLDLGYLRIIPNLVCLAPKDKEEMEDMLEFAINLNCPVSIRYPKACSLSLSYREKIELAKAQVLTKGKDVCIIALGSMVWPAKQCGELFKKEKKEIFLVNARFIKPLDELLFKNLAENFPLIIILEEASLAAGFGSALIEFYEQQELLQKTKVVRFGLSDEFITFGKREELLAVQGLDVNSIFNKIKKIITNYESSILR